MQQQNSISPIKLAILFLLLHISFFLSPSISFADSKKEDVNSQNYQNFKEEISKIESYLNSINNITASFQQRTFEGEINKSKLIASNNGKLLISKKSNSLPKIRIEYLDSPKILIIINGSVIAYKDIDLDETSYLKTSITPASFLIQKNISFSNKNFQITNIDKKTDQITINLLQKDNKDFSDFKITFNLEPTSLKQIEVVNNLGQKTIFTLTAIDNSSLIANNKFTIKNQNLSQ